MTNIYFKDGKAEGKAEGLAEGLAEGRASGKVEGELEMAARLLNSKFGKLSAEQLECLKELSSNELLAIPDRIFDAKSINDLIPNKKH